MDEHTKNFLDWVSLGTVVTVVLQWLPTIAVVLSIVWSLIRIYESDTFQKILRFILRKKHANE